MKYYLKVANRQEYIDLESTTEIEATLASLKISADEVHHNIGYVCYWYNYLMPSEADRDSKTYLIRTNEEERFNLENKVISKWV